MHKYVCVHQIDQIFGTNYQLQAVDFSYLLAQSRHLYSNTYTAPYSMSVPVVQDRIDTSTIGAHSHSYSQRDSNKPVNYRSSSSSYNGNHDAENKQGGDLNALISKSLNSITSSSSSSIYSALKATSCLMVDVQRTSVNMPASKVQRLPFWKLFFHDGIPMYVCGWIQEHVSSYLFYPNLIRSCILGFIRTNLRTYIHIYIHTFIYIRTYIPRYTFITLLQLPYQTIHL